MFQHLVAYKAEVRDCKVPQIYSSNPKLAAWVCVNRREYKRGKLDPGKIEKLNVLGFSWNSKEDSWNEMFQHLVEYHKLYGHSKVPLHYSNNLQLGRWVAGNRQRYKKGTLNTDKIEKLDVLGFSWNPHDDYWEQIFQNLIEFKQVYNHCNVPLNYSNNPQLGTWVNTNRQRYKKGKLDQDKIEKLNQLGFEWTCRKTTKPAETDQEPSQLSLFD